MTDQIISELAIAAVKERLRAEGQLVAIRRLSKEEPDLCYEISQAAINALDGVEGVPLEAHDAVYRAVWKAVLIALGSYRIAHYRLWFQTEFGGQLPDPENPGPPPAAPEDRPDSGDANDSGGGEVQP